MGRSMELNVTRHTRRVLRALLWLAWLVALGAVHPAYAQGICEIRNTPPKKNAPPLRFCSWYYASSCCLPAHDADMSNKFLALVEAGPTCEKYQSRAKLFLAMAFCYGCDPDEPLHFSKPLNTAFFNATKTAKICRTIADQLAPSAFSDCGLTVPDDRETVCSPNSAVAPEAVWPDCQNGEYVCQSTGADWFCSNVPCGPDGTPPGFADAPCSVAEGTCGGALMFLNDNRAAKPPYFEEYPVEIVDEHLCLSRHANSSRCKCLKPPISTARCSGGLVNAVWFIALCFFTLSTIG